MVNIIAIIVGTITAAGGCLGGACRYYDVRQRELHEQREERERREQRCVTPPSRPNTPVPNTYHLDHFIDDIAMEQLKQRNSDTDTEIDIRISIHNHHEENKKE